MKLRFLPTPCLIYNTTMLSKSGKYKVGQVVYAKVDPYVALVVKSFLSRIYYCQVKNEPDKKELVYFERELLGVMVPLAKIKAG